MIKRQNIDELAVAILNNLEDGPVERLDLHLNSFLRRIGLIEREMGWVIRDVLQGIYDD